MFRWKMSRESCVCSWLLCRIKVTSAAEEVGARAFPAVWRRQTYVAAKSCGQSPSLYRKATENPAATSCFMPSELISFAHIDHHKEFQHDFSCFEPSNISGRVSSLSISTRVIQMTFSCPVRKQFMYCPYNLKKRIDYRNMANVPVQPTVVTG